MKYFILHDLPRYMSYDMKKTKKSMSRAKTRISQPVGEMKIEQPHFKRQVTLLLC